MENYFVWGKVNFYKDLQNKSTIPQIENIYRMLYLSNNLETRSILSFNKWDIWISVSCVFLVGRVMWMYAQVCLTLCDPMDCSSPALLSVGFPRQEYWSGLPFPSPEDLQNPEIEPVSPDRKEDSFFREPPGKPQGMLHSIINILTEVTLVY